MKTKTPLTYREFRDEMSRLLKASFEYTPEQAGFSIYGDKMADLAEAHPDFDDRLMNDGDAPEDEA